jgi:hypothetical protein
MASRDPFITVKGPKKSQSEYPTIGPRIETTTSEYKIGVLIRAYQVLEEKLFSR